jgi:hypothetical protein
LNLFALGAVVVLAGALLAVFGSLYLVAARSFRRGELAEEGLRMLRWALLGQVALYVLLAITAFLT